MAARSTARYRWQGSALLRATTDPGALDLPRDLDLTSEDAAALGRAWLAGVWQRAEIREALSIASPALCQRIDDIVAGGRSDARRVRRAVLSLASYLLRWQGRPTPFGLFAGVAPARIGAEPKVSWGGNHRTVVRADADWLTDIVTRLHQCPQLLERLPVIANSAGHVRGGRYVVPGPPADGRGHLLAPVEVSVRHTRPVAAALAAARTPISYGELRARLAERAPAAADRIDAMLGGLVAQHVLITSLWAPMTCLNALTHVCSELHAVDAPAIPAIAELVRELYAIRDDLAHHGPAAPSAWAGPVGRMQALSDIAAVPVVVDTALDCDVQLPEQVALEAQEAVGVLGRLSPCPFGHQHWRDYHRRFRARYGPGAVVPLLDLVADSGLGLPAGYLGSARQRAEPQLTARDEKLLALIQRAMLDGSGEIVLTDPVINDLAGDDTDVIFVPRAEVSVEIHAATPEALTRGSFRLVVTGTPRPGSSMAGRVAHLLPDQDQTRLADSYQAAVPETITAQLSFAPRRRRNDNVTRTRQLLPHVISLAEHQQPYEGLIPLSDLAVTADARQFFLIQLSTGRPVEPRVLHALEAGIHTPPLARFLAEITTARSAVYKAFDFGAANHLPYLPRVRYRRTILARARWLLTTEELPGRKATTAAWQDAFAAWRERLRVPERVSVIEVDQRLPLDLTHPLHLLLLRARLESARRLELREAPTPEDVAWIGRAHELLLPLTLTRPPGRGLPSASSPVRAVAADAGHLPGRSTILNAHLHAHPARYDEILTEHLPGLTETFPKASPWWFSRHRETSRADADLYLTLSVRLPGAADYGQAAERLHAWADHLRRRRLASHVTLATYQPQTGRYGHGLAMDAAHQAFAADSAAALAQIQMAAHADIHPQALAAASVVDLATSFAPTVDEGLTWLVRHLPKEQGALDRTLRDQTLDLADRHQPRERLRSLPGGADVAAAWQARAAALSAYRKHVAGQRDPLSILRSLLHLHHVRAIGIVPDLERVTGRLARACALRHTHTVRGTS